MTAAPPTPSLYLIAGLGNPGGEYRTSRHNIGFMAVSRLAERLGASFTRLEARALVCKADHQGRRLILAKPQTFMNLSGQAVKGLVNFYKVPLANLLVIYDDIDLPFGALRLRPDGGSGGHHGMESIIERLGSQDFPRLRLGIGRPPGQKGARGYVLQDFTRPEETVLPALLDRAAEAALVFVTAGLEQAMNQYNGSLPDDLL
jgi:PTH1 family peptidyl-tRNA hydrolase